MTPIFIIFALILLASSIAIALMFQLFYHEKSKQNTGSMKVKLLLSGFIAFIMDTIGVGSFAGNIACAKFFKTFHDHELPAVINCAQVIPGLIEAMLFYKMVTVDTFTLVSLVIAASIGGILGGLKISRLKPQGIRIFMCICFPLLIGLLVAEHTHILPIGGRAFALSGFPLIFAFVGVMAAAFLGAVGIGFFATVQGILFLAGMSPIAAFPIMMTAGALQQPLTSITFLKQSQIPMTRCFYLIAGGLLGVMIAIPIMKHLSILTLHTLLILVLFYNTLMMVLSIYKEKKAISTSALTST